MSLAKVLGLVAKAQLAEIANYESIPVTTYVHTSNSEITVSSVNTTTDTFTCIGHGLTNGVIVAPTLDVGVGSEYLLNVVPGGLTKSHKYVVNATEDTFQLSLTAGGAAIDLTDNVNLDLTKWHFETIASLASSIIISDLAPRKKYRLKIHGKLLSTTLGNYVRPTTVGLENTWYGSGYYDYPWAGIGSDVFMQLNVIIDFASDLVIKYEGFGVSSTNASSNTKSNIMLNYANPNYSATDITSIILQAWALANGTTVEVYNA